MMKFTDEHKLSFLKVYKQPYASVKMSEGEDLHQQFADELSIDRYDAKQLCHMINYHLDRRVF